MSTAAYRNRQDHHPRRRHGQSQRHHLRKGCTPAQLALAWVLAQGNDIVPIPGTKRRQYLEENVGALDIRLTPEDLTEIDKLIPPGAASGSRYSEPGMRAINR